MAWVFAMAEETDLCDQQLLFGLVEDSSLNFSLDEKPETWAKQHHNNDQLAPAVDLWHGVNAMLDVKPCEDQDQPCYPEQPWHLAKPKFLPCILTDVSICDVFMGGVGS